MDFSGDAPESHKPAFPGQNLRSEELHWLESWTNTHEAKDTNRESCREASGTEGDVSCPKSHVCQNPVLQKCHVLVLNTLRHLSCTCSALAGLAHTIYRLPCHPIQKQGEIIKVPLVSLTVNDLYHTKRS